MSPEKIPITNNLITNNLITRPPVVVVLGHVDHGKSTLIERVKEIKITEKESGGITQHIGAYTVEHEGKPITFIDTPGHEAFSKMRARGARVADIAVLVVAADEGIKPQTKESLEIIRQAGIPFVVALNKIDKPEANPDRVKGELAEAGVLLEGWGGDVPNVAISAKTSQGIPELLELILLVAELAEFTVDNSAPARGIVIESRRDPRRGAVATLLVQKGTLRVGEEINIAEGVRAKIKHMENFLGQKLVQAQPAMPALVLGFSEPPVIGAEFWVDQNQEKEIPGKLLGGSGAKFEIRDASAEALLPLIIKADVHGSLEAIDSVLRSLPVSQVGLSVLDFDVGDITENEVKLAVSTGARIVGFRVGAPKPVMTLAAQLNVTIKTVTIIYELADILKELMRKLLRVEIIRTDLGALSVLAKFKFEGKRMVVGGKVVTGVAAKQALVDIIRAEKRVGGGNLLELQQNKVPVDRVEQGNECGLLIDGDALIQVGDTLRFYTEEKRERQLE